MFDRKEILNIITKLIADNYYGVNIDIIEESSIINGTKCGLDSLDWIELIMLLEEKFNVQISESEIENISDVKTLIDIIIDKMEKK